MDWMLQFVMYVPWLSVPLVLVSCAFLAWHLRRCCSDAGLWANVRKSRTKLRNMLCPDCPADPIYSKINEIEQARCVQNTKRIFRVFHVYNAYMMVSIIWSHSQALSGHELPEPDTVVWAFLSYLICFVLDVFSCLITVRSLRLLVIVPVAVHIWNLLIQDWNELEYTQYIAFSVLWRMSVCILYTDVPMNIGLNLTASLVCYMVSPYDEASQLEFFALAMILVVSCSNKRVRVAEIRATLEATSSRSFLDAMDALLSNICDVVLQLSNDFRISKPSPRLATMLFKSSPHSLRGDMILDLASNSHEASRVAAFLNRADGSAAVVHTCFKDSHHSPVKVQLFHARGLDINDEPFHVLGVLECEEAQRPVPDTEYQMLSLADTIKEGEVISEASSEISGHVGAKLVWVDHLAPGIPIVKSSAGFAALGGPCAPGDRFLDSVRNKDDFLWQLRHCITGPGLEEVFSLKFRLPYKGHGTRTVYADVGVESVQHDGRVISKLTIRNVTKPGSHSGRSSSTESSGGDSRPRLWHSEGTPPRAAERPTPGPQTCPSKVDGANCVVLSLNVLDDKFESLDAAVVGRGVGVDFGIKVGDAFLDWVTEPGPLKFAVLRSLFQSTKAHEVKEFLEDESLSVEAYILCFRPTEIGRFVLSQSKDRAPSDFHVVEVAVLKFFTYNSGCGLCCTIALSPLQQTLTI